MSAAKRRVNAVAAMATIVAGTIDASRPSSRLKLPVETDCLGVAHTASTRARPSARRASPWRHPALGGDHLVGDGLFASKRMISRVP